MSLPLVILLVLIVYGMLLSLVVILERRNPTAGLAWIAALIFLPGAGLVLYWLLGRRPVRRRRRWRSRRRQILLTLAAPQDCRGQFSPSSPAAERLVELAERLAGAPPACGNVVRVLRNAEHAYPEMRKAISRARSFVHQESYIFRSDAEGRKFAQVLARAARRGVDVRLLLDAAGSFDCDLAIFDELLAAGGRVELFSPIKWQALSNRTHYRNHRKLLVVDGEVGFLGGLNIGTEYTGRDKEIGFWRDTHMKVFGPGANHLEQLFLEDWLFVTGEALEGVRFFNRSAQALGSATVQVVPSGPDLEWGTYHKILLHSIGAAVRRIHITSPYFVPDEAIREALLAAALSGVDVKLLVPSRSDLPLVSLAGRSYFPELLQAGVQIFEYQRGFIHAKTYVIDDWAASVGSANMDIRSFQLNYEVNALVYSPEFVSELENLFQADLKHARRVTLAEHRHRPLRLRLMEGTARLLSPLL